MRPTTGIMTTRDFGNSKFFQVACQCGNPDDDISFEVEADPETKTVSVNTWTYQKTDCWSEKFPQTSGVTDVNSRWWSINYSARSFINDVYRRVSLAFKILVRGHITYSQTIIMSEEQALNYAETIKQAIIDVKATL